MTCQKVLLAEGQDKKEAKSKEYSVILPKLREDLRDIYLQPVLLVHPRKNDPFKQKDYANQETF